VATATTRTRDGLKWDLCTIIAVGLITLLVTVMVVREGAFTILNPSVAAEHWELLMRQLRR
jgi:hypothetical protein